MRAGFFWQVGHTLSRADRAAKRAALSTHPSPQEGGKISPLDLSAPVHHCQTGGGFGSQYQPEVYPDANLYPQEGSSSDDNTSKTGGASQPDALFSKQEGTPNDEITYQKYWSSPNPIITLSDQELERDKVEHGDEDTDNNHIPTPPTGYPHPTNSPQTWYLRPTHFPDLEPLYQKRLNTQRRVKSSSRRKQNINKLLMTMYLIVQEKLR